MKLLKIAALLLALALLLAGCGNRVPIDSPNQIASKLKTYAAENADWAEVKADKLSSYFGFSDDALDDFSVHINSSEECFDIIAVFKIADENFRKEVVTGISFMTEASRANYEIASKAQAEKIADKVVAEVQDTIILCIIDNYSQIKAYLTDELGAEIIS